MESSINYMHTYCFDIFFHTCNSKLLLKLTNDSDQGKLHYIAMFLLFEKIKNDKSKFKFQLQRVTVVVVGCRFSRRQ